jgi:hypothetical protein
MLALSNGTTLVGASSSADQMMKIPFSAKYSFQNVRCNPVVRKSVTSSFQAGLVLGDAAVQMFLKFDVVNFDLS